MALRRRTFITAAQLAELCEVSERTVYRDIRDLERSGVPILGEAGVGYRLRPGFDLPPLMFTEDEIEALVLGARMVQRFSDPELSRAAQKVIDKAHAVVPDNVKARLDDTRMFAMRFSPLAGSEHLGALRNAIVDRHRVEVAYRDKHDVPTQRRLCPLGLYFWGATWTLGAWCDLRQAHRNFRLDRIADVTVLADAFPDTAPYTLDDYVRTMRERDRITPGYP